MSMTDFRTLGRSGLAVSPLTLGTMTFGTARWGLDEAGSRAVFDSYVEAGSNAVDIANVYAGGRSEERRAGSSRLGVSVKTPSDSIRASAASRHRCSQPGPDRAKTKPDLTYKRRENGEHVTLSWRQLPVWQTMGGALALAIPELTQISIRGRGAKISYRF